MSWADAFRVSISLPRRWLGRAAEPQVLFPSIAILVLTVLWGTTLNLVEVDRANTERTLYASAVELLDTYEAQMLRNLREIDQTLKVVKYAYESTGDAAVLADLKRKALLPPDLLFLVRIVDAHGKVIASNRADAGTTGPVENRQHHLSAEGLYLGRLQRENGADWSLDFSRRLNRADGGFGGIIVVSVDASYFVSGYDRNRLGDHGVLGLVGTQDGIFRVRRTGDTISSNDTQSYPSTHVSREIHEIGARRVTNEWDGVTRVISTRALYAFALTLVVGLSEAEQMTATQDNARSYVLRTVLASALLLLFIAALGNVSWKLARTAKRENEAKLEHSERVHYLAYRDALTSLPNRELFSKMLEQGISQARRYNRGLAVLFLDLDRFKQINDTLGHPAGDKLLRAVANRLQSCLRDSDTVARLGGDEFVVVLPEFEEERYVANVAQKLLNVVSQPFPLQGQDVITTTSIGIAIFPRDGPDEQTLMKNADTAMYHAKRQGKNNFQFYSAQMPTHSLQSLKLETSLRQAMDRDEFQVHYQPKVDLTTGKITGMESLLRWQSAQHGVVSPVDFIPIAEDTGLIVPIGRWVLETACAQTVRWQKKGLPGVCVAVNLSARQFSDERLLDDIKSILAQTGLEPRFLELEITESMLMNNVEKAIRTLVALSDMKIRLAIDDFGTGYSSLSNLKRFPLHTLKIDRAFISDLPNDADGRVITEAIIGMGKALRLTVVAEGVETAAQEDYLRMQGCDEYQGYYFSKPVPAEQFGNLLAAQGQAKGPVQFSQRHPQREERAPS